jgi:hypothetical protein
LDVIGEVMSDTIFLDAVQYFKKKSRFQSGKKHFQKIGWKYTVNLREW